MVQDLAQMLASSRKDHLPEWRFAQYNGDLLQRHQWFGQFSNAINSAPITDDVKLTYLETLVIGQAKTAIAEFSYWGTMYKEALKTSERRFGQPQAVVSAYLDKLSHFPMLKMHNSENLISYSATISTLVGVFRSLLTINISPVHHSWAKRHRSVHQIWKKHGLCLPWRIWIVRHYSNSKIGWRTKQRHMRKWNCPQENRRQQPIC